MRGKILAMAGTVIGVTALEFLLMWPAAVYFRDCRVVAALISFLEWVHSHTHAITVWWPMTFSLGLPGIIASLVIGAKLGRTGREQGLLVAVGLGFWVIAYVAGVFFLFVLFAITSPSDRPIWR